MVKISMNFHELPNENITFFLGVMTDQQKSLLTKKWQTIIENVRAEDIIDYLTEVGI